MVTEECDVNEIRSMERDLPKPSSVYYGSGSYFYVYKAKDWKSKKWTDPFLRQILLYSRKTYLRYGDRELLDKYDSKASIYLVRASYWVEGVYIHEWLSIRMVPGHLRPQGGGELEIYSYNSQRLDLYMKKRNGRGRDFWKDVISSSRMCGISPYIKDNSEQFDYPKLSRAHKHTAICFAIIHEEFRLEYVLPYSCITAIIRNDLAQQVLTVNQSCLRVCHKFTPAHHYLNFQDGKDIKLDRGVYSYRFPIYWFNVRQLFTTLRLLLKTGKLSEKSIMHYLKTGRGFAEIVANRGEELARLGDLLSVEGKIKFSDMYGKTLRRIIDQYVEDGPELKITGANDWNASIAKMIELSGISKVS